MLYFLIDPQQGDVCSVEYSSIFTHGNSVPCDPQPSGTAPMVVQATLGSLSPATTYHYRLLLANQSGTRVPADAMFTTLSAPPAATTGIATNVTARSVTLNGTVNPNGSPVDDCHFEYGPTSAYGDEAPCATLPGNGTTAVPVSATVPWPGSGTLRYRLVARNASGTSTGSDAAFSVIVDDFLSQPDEPPVVNDSPVVVDSSGSVDAPGTGTAKVIATRRSGARQIAVDLICSGQPGDVCRGTLTLSARARLHGRRRTVPLGRAAFDLTAPHRATLVVALFRRGRRLLSRHPQIRPRAHLLPAPATS